MCDKDFPVYKKRIVVTGPNSMIGRAVCQELDKCNAKVLPIYHQNCDLTNWDSTFRAFSKLYPIDGLIHLAACTGGITYNRENPATTFANTSWIALNTLYCARMQGVKKSIVVLSSCAFPYCNDSITEESILDGPCHPSIASHGYAKRLAYLYGYFTNQQHDTNIYSVCLQNNYGPYAHFEPNRGKVIEELIRKFVTAKDNDEPYVECLGSGEPLRSFLFSEDSGQAIVEALETFTDHRKPLNIGWPEEISIKELAELIADKVGYQGEIRWNTSYEDGQYRKYLDCSRFWQTTHVTPTPLSHGIEKTVQWYVDNRPVSR